MRHQCANRGRGCQQWNTWYVTVYSFIVLSIGSIHTLVNWWNKFKVRNGCRRKVPSRPCSSAPIPAFSIVIIAAAVIAIIVVVESRWIYHISGRINTPGMTASCPLLGSQTLNANPNLVERESEIVGQAGRLGVVTCLLYTSPSPRD